MQIEWVRAYVEKLLRVGLTGPPVPDADGDYPFRWGTAACWVRICEEPFLRVEVFAHAALGVKGSVALLRELNDLTAGLLRGRVYVRDGVVVMEDNIPASAVTPEELAESCACVGTLGHELGVMLAAMFDGQTPFPADAEPIESEGA